MTGYKIALIATTAALLGLIAAFTTGVLKWADTHKLSTAFLAGGSAFVAIATAVVTIATTIASVDS